MAAVYKYIAFALVVVVAVHSAPSEKPPVCTINGRDYQVGESVTGDPCDNCSCTPWGPMCQLIMCPEALCEDKVKAPGQCCYTCPNGPNCEYRGNSGRTLVPDEGCRYSIDSVCFCYRDNIENRLMPFCLPPFPRDIRKPCNVTEA